MEKKWNEAEKEAVRYGAEHQDDRFPAAYPFHPKGRKKLDEGGQRHEQ